MVVFLAWHHINDIARTPHVFLSGVTCDSIIGSATYGRIRSIGISSRRLTGTLPSTIGNFQSLTLIDFSYNSLTGTIPSTISTLTSLTGISFYSNSLTGTIPSTISTLTSLTYLDLRYNYLTMGAATSVPISTFSATTLSGNLYLDNNCLVFYTKNPYRTVTSRHCRDSFTSTPIPGKY